MIQFYKPNSKNTGAASSFWYSPKARAFFVSIIKQESWNLKTKTGSFQKNKNDPQKNILIKLNLNELGGIIDCIESNREFSGYHSSGQTNNVTKIKFAPYKREEEKVDLGDVEVSNEKATLKGKIVKTQEKQLGFVLFASKEPKDDPSQKVSFSIAFNFGESVALRQSLFFMINSLLGDIVYDIKQKSVKNGYEQGNTSREVKENNEETSKGEEQEDAIDF